MRLPAGFKLDNPRVSEDGQSVIYDVTVARWRMAWMVLGVLLRGRFRIREWL